MSERDTLTLDDATEFRYSRGRFRVIAGPDREREATTRAPEFTIGTDRGNDLALTDATVSRHHCVVTATEHGFVVRDLASKNGTRLGDHRVVEAFLKPGSQLQLGATTVRFDVLDEIAREPLARETSYGVVLGRSDAMRRIFAVLPRVAPSDVAILIEGETGTGKTLLAQAIHRESPRAAKPFVVIDCAAIPPTLIESELFGHEKGAFTGAHTARAGAFQAAHGGTVFLDEIGELPIDLQPKLLRAIEERSVRRVGSDTPLSVDVRIIAATNRELRREVNRGAFRSDLFYRLQTVSLRMPALRERRDDIAMLVAHFYDQYSGGGAAPPELVARLSTLDWPGNVRELRSAVERVVLLGDPAVWETIATPPPDSHGHVFDPAVSFRVAKTHATARWERAYVDELVQLAGGNLSRAARMAKMDRNYLRELVVKHAIAIRDD